MRTLSLTFALLLASPLAIAAPRHHRAPRAAKANTAAQDQFVVTCINERTGPTGGIPVKDAIKLCQAIVRNQSKIAKAAARAAKAIEACEVAVVNACFDAGEPSCEDAALRSSGAFDVCTGHGPAFVAQGR